jgi:uncharacterized protein
MRRRRLRRLAVLLSMAYLALCCAAGIFLAEVTLHPGRRTLSAVDDREAQEMAARQQSEIANVAISASDGTHLLAWNLRLRRGNDNAVILLHGLSDNRMGVLGYAEMLLRHGFSVVMPDARAHGASGGNLATYGLLEAGDIHRWVEWVQERQHSSCIFGFGESMGAAQLLGSPGTEPRFCAVAAESPFPAFARSPMTAWGSSFTPDRGWGDRYCVR